MSILKVARMGHPILRTPARPLEPSEITTPTIQQLIEDITETMLEYDGIGLAAPQVHQGVRLFLARSNPDASETADRLQMLVAINPHVAAAGRETIEDWEGCLSIPDMRGLVPRAREVTIKAFDARGRRFELRARDLFARVIQHETDHLDGVLFLDRMKSLDSLTFFEEYVRYHRKSDWASCGLRPEVDRRQSR